MLHGKRVRRAAAGGGEGGPDEANDDDDDDDDDEDGEGGVARSEAHKLRPSYVAWHSAPQAQRFGNFRCAMQRAQHASCFVALTALPLLAPRSAEEKAALDVAIAAYADENAFDPEQLEWLYHTRVGRKQRKAWLAIAEALPHRSPRQVWGHATRRLHAQHGQKNKRWGVEDSAALRSLVEQRGRDWVAIGAELGRLPDSCRDRWRKIDKPYASGKWSEAEVAALRAAVEAQQAQRRAAPQPAGTGTAYTTRDNFDWKVIAAAIGTRSAAQANSKWYDTVAPSMHEAGTWGAGDDGRLLRYLRDVRAGEATEVDWAAAVAGRSSAAALRRWKLMLKHVPGAVDRGFAGCVAYLVDKFAAKLADSAPDA